MNSTFTELYIDPRTGHRELFVYIRGQLVMKRWLDTGAACMFQVAPSWTEWYQKKVT